MGIVKRIKDYFDPKNYLGKETWKRLQEAKKNPCLLGVKNGRIALFDQDKNFIRYVEE